MTTTQIAFAAATALAGVCTIRSKQRGDLRSVILFKVTTMGLIAAMFLLQGVGHSRGASWYLVGAALTASIAGDILLELPSDRFIVGLVSFLVAHIAYVAAFGLQVVRSPGWLQRPAVWIALALLGMYAVAVSRILGGSLGPLQAPVTAYVAVISVMSWMAAAAYLLSPTLARLETLGGVALFMLSDTLLAIDKFKRPLRAAQALILSTYFAAQWLIAASSDGF